MINWNNGVPATGHNPSNDYTLMEQNNNNNPLIWDVDHIGFNVNNSGWHTVIHLNTQGSDPAPAAVDQIYSRNVTFAGSTDTQLFNITAAGGISQITGSHAAANGYVWCAGLLFQWGVVLSPGTSGIVSFNNNPNNAIFPHSCFNVQISLQRGSAGQTATIDNANPPTANGFGFLTSSSGSNALYWFAIGN
jgi:hypothetical protein